VDEHVQPAASLLAQPPAVSTGSTSTGSTAAGSTPADSSAGTDDGADSGAGGDQGSRSAMGDAGGRDTSTSGGPQAADGDEPASAGDRQGMMPLSDPESARAGYRARDTALS
jgi:hypothetical protein